MPLLALFRELKRYLKIGVRPQDPEDPDEPFAMVGARLNPRRPLGRSSVAVPPEP